MSDKKNSSSNNNNLKGPSKGGEKSPKFPIWIYVVLLLALFGIQFYFMNTSGGERIKYSTFLSYVEKGYIDQITIENGAYIKGEYSEKAVKEGIAAPPGEDEGWQLDSSSTGSSSSTFTTTMLEGDEIRPVLDQHGVTYDVQIDDDWFSGILIWLIPIGLAIVFWIFIFRRMNPGQQVLNIGKNKAS